MIDVERLKVDAAYWDEAVSKNAVAAQDMGKGQHPCFFTQEGVEIFLETGSESQLIYRPQPSTASQQNQHDIKESARKVFEQKHPEWYRDGAMPDLVSPASLLTDEQAEARMGEPIVIERANVQQANVDGGLAVNDVILRKASEPHDPINSPSHYASGGIECIDAMQAMLSRDEFIGYLRGNIFKYQWRYKLKNGVEDLKKAQWYQNKLIEVESK